MKPYVWYRKLRTYMQSKAIVLMYHRVSDLLIDPFELAVGTDNFDQQLQVLKKRFNVLPVDEMVYLLERKKIPSNAVCITFDDGYADNYTNALPLLEKHQCAATFYITSGLIGRSAMYWWDELQYIFLHTFQLPSFLSVNINGELFEQHLQNEGALSVEDWQKSKSWLFENAPVTQRCQLFKTVWSKIKPLPHNQQQLVLQELKSWAQLPFYYGKDHLPMTIPHLQAISGHPLFDLGIHTHTHPSLPLCDENIQYQEIEFCNSFLKNNNLSFVPTISYPFGDHNEDTIAIAKAQQLKGGFTTNEHIITKRTSLMSIGRFQVKNWSGPVFLQQLRHWLK